MTARPMLVNMVRNMPSGLENIVENDATSSNGKVQYPRTLHMPENHSGANCNSSIRKKSATLPYIFSMAQTCDNVRQIRAINLKPL